jgi:putative phosphoesterase
MATKIAIFSDIHGNSTALKSVIQELQNEKDIQHIYCLGDMLGVGHESNEVLEILFSMDKISFVKGNHDQEIINIIKGQPNPYDPLIEHHKWLAERIDTKFHQKLLDIPQTIQNDYEGKVLYFTHYQFDAQGNFYPSDPEPTVTKFESYYTNKNINADIICFGHHHKVHFFQSKTRTYINPGPVGLDNFQPKAKYCLIDINQKNLSVNFREVPYNLEEFYKFIVAFDRLQVPFADRIVRSCYTMV